MARSTSAKGGNSKVRFIMFEAKMSDGDLSQVAQVLQNALRPTQLPAKIIQIAAPASSNGEVVAELDEQLEDVVEPDANSSLQSKRVRSGASQKRSFYTPKVVPVDCDTDPSLRSFIDKHPPKNVNAKFLAVLAWFHEARAIKTVSVDQVFTCFKHLEWSTGLKDFSQPLRDLKGQDLIGGGAKAGFEINHVGLDRVTKYASGK